MPITPKFKLSDLQKKVLKEGQKIEASMLAILIRLGEQFVTDARDNMNIDSSAFPGQHRTLKNGKNLPKGAFQDRTSNLRNSIGYFILKDHQIVREAFPGGNKDEARTFVKSLQSKPGLRLIGVAGMQYGVYVESKGFNVITSQSFIVIDRLNAQLKKLQKKRNFDADTNFNISSEL